MTSKPNEMDKVYRVLLCLFVGSNSYAQQPLAIDSMEVNTLKVQLYADGGLGKIQTNDTGVYKSLVYAQNLWFGGMDASGSLRVSAQTYRQNRVNFYPGPISNDPNAYSKYNKVYHISIQTLTDFKNGNTTGIPAEIANWPAHGDTTMGEAYNLAPFVDINQDGTYDPSDGDYPKIKGDEALYAIFNDQNGSSNGFGLEIRAMVYGYSTGNIEDSTLFIDYQVFNRSSNPYDSCYFSSFVDFDNGNYFDDLIGTNITGDAIFSYNADNDDEGPLGFGTRPAAIGMRVLKGPPANYFDAVDNNKDGCIDGIRKANGSCEPEDPAAGIREHFYTSGSMYFNTGLPATSYPTASNEFYNYMKSQWRNGNNLIIESPSGFMSTGNGDGYVATNIGTATHYMYPGNSIDTTGAFEPLSPIDWFEAPTSTSDSRCLANAGPFDLSPGQSFDLRLGFVWSRDSSNLTGYSQINGLVKNLDTTYYNKPVRNVGITTYSRPNSFQVFYQQDYQEWVIKTKEPVSLKLYSLQGQMVTEIQIESGTRRPLDLSELSQGVYLLTDPQTGTTYKLLW